MCLGICAEQLKDGIHIVVREKERGLSEGQAQRAAIARAILQDGYGFLSTGILIARVS